MIAPLDWPWLSVGANAWALGKPQPPLPPFAQKHMLFFCFHSLFHSQTRRITQQAEVGQFSIAAVGHTYFINHEMLNATAISESDTSLCLVVVFCVKRLQCEWPSSVTAAAHAAPFLWLSFCYLPSSLNTLQHSTVAATSNLTRALKGYF